MRGLAALAVVCFHFSKTLAPGGYLAVDFFFGLSGFVIAKSYRARLASGLLVPRFMMMRLVRLYPLFLAGILLGAMHAVQLAWRGGAVAMDTGAIVRAMLLGVVMLPDPLSAELYPLNVVLWSIATEILVNLLFAAVLAHLARSWLLALVAMWSALLVALSVRVGDIGAGMDWSSVPLGTLRTFASFTIGVVVAGIDRSRLRPSSATAVLLCCALVLALLLPVGQALRYRFDLTMILAGFPVLLWLGSRVEPPVRVASVAGLLGDASYALYATHLPLVHAAAFVARWTRLPLAALLPALLLLALAVAMVLTRYWDKPVRRWINDRLALRQSAMP